jgi:hypothetical protein
MDLTRITYEGRKVYSESQTGNTWAPGDTKLVPSVAAEKLLRFVEFKRAAKEGKLDESSQPTDVELETAMVVQQETDRAQDEEKQVLESMLLTVESMDKSALEQYALKYEVTLDKRLSVAKLRSEVSTLVEQFGAR